MTATRLSAAALLSLACLPLIVRAQPVVGADLKVYRTKYYELHTDLDEDGVREAKLRITLMAEEYHRRTHEFAGAIERPLPFYLFKDMKGYVAAGGRPDSAGVFMGDRLMAVANPQDPLGTWHTIQHEGFHQFVHAVIGGKIPVWANEGMAEYFGEGVFCGDEFYVGLVSPTRLARLQKRLRDHKFMPIRDMMRTEQEIWNTALTSDNYDQAWSMVHFLAHAENGRYQRPFTTFLKEVGDGRNWEDAWEKSFGSNFSAFEERWEKYWLDQPEMPTAGLYAMTVCSTITSFVGRSASQHQTFDSFDDFSAAAKEKQLRMDAEDWLPYGVLELALRRAPKLGTWSLESKAGKKLVVCELESGERIEGTYVLRGSRIKSVNIVSKPPRKRK